MDGANRFYESIDLIDAFHPQTILACDMGGAPLLPAHGAPVRLRVERQPGYKMAKFLSRIEVVDRFDGMDGDTAARGRMTAMNGMPGSERVALASQGRGPLQWSRMTAPDPKLLTREILLGFWKVHILHHAADEPVVGQWILTELRRHGYDISPGTLYPLLKRMERNGWLRCEVEPDAGPRGRRYYHLTPGGAAVLEVLREAVSELHHEVIEESRQKPRKPERMLTFAATIPDGHAQVGKKRQVPARPRLRAAGQTKRRQR